MTDNRAVSGKVVRGAQPLLGAERDEIAELVSRIKQADARARQPAVSSPQPLVSPARAEDEQWAEDWKLPREMLDYFILERR